MTRRFCIITLGCKANQYDGQAMGEALRRAGWAEVTGKETPGLCIVNTCTVTGTADHKCRQLVRRLIEEHPGAQVFVTGCGAQAAPEAFGNIPGVAEVIPNPRKMQIPAMLTEQAPPAEGTETWAGGVSEFRAHTRAFLKIQEGCDAGCSYCIVPSVRGPSRSRRLNDLAAEAARLVQHGHKEIVLTGIHLGHYGRDLDPPSNLSDAIRTLLALEGLARIRLSSIEMNEIDDELIELTAASAKVCPHVHVPLQSGDNGVLARMDRPYTRESFLERVGRIREAIEEPALTTDLLVGFPGEDERAFENTLAACREAGFSRTHVFPFSPRPGTPAAEFADRVPASVMTERTQRARELGAELARQFHETFIGREVEVLVEGRREPRNGNLCGYTARYVRVQFPGPDGWKNQMVRVRAEAIGPEPGLGLTAKPVSEPGQAARGNG